MSFQRAIVDGIGPIDPAETTLGNVVPIGPRGFFVRPVGILFFFQIDQIAPRQVFETGLVVGAIAVSVAVRFRGTIVDGVGPGGAAEFGHVDIESELGRGVGRRR